MQDASAGTNDLGVGLTQTALDEGVVNCRTDRLVDVLTRHHVVNVEVDHATGHADDHRRNGCVENVEERHLVKVLDATVRAFIVGTNRVAAVSRYEDLLDDQFLGARTSQADDKPVIDNLEVAALNPE